MFPSIAKAQPSLRKLSLILDPSFLDKVGIAIQLKGKRWRIHYARMQHGTPVRMKMVTGRIFLNLMNYKSLGDLRMTCEGINNNRFLALCEFTVNRVREKCITGRWE